MNGVEGDDNKMDQHFVIIAGLESKDYTGTEIKYLMHWSALRATQTNGKKKQVLSRFAEN